MRCDSCIASDAAHPATATNAAHARELGWKRSMHPPDLVPHWTCPECRAGFTRPQEITLPFEPRIPGELTGSVILEAELRRRLANYDVGVRIGRGSAGLVYSGRHRESGQRVAIKVMRGHADDFEAEARFRREVDALRRLDSPHVVRLLDHGALSHQLYLVMEEVRGISLREVIGSMPVTEPAAIGIVKDICHGLNAAHRAGLLHRDIKPENVLIDTTGLARLIDFGLARPFVRPEDEVSITRPLHHVGTPGYVAPEVRAGSRTPDPRIDVYAVGVILVELFTHRIPTGPTDPLLRRMPRGLANVARDALAEDPVGRIASPEELRQRLRRGRHWRRLRRRFARG